MDNNLSDGDRVKFSHPDLSDIGEMEGHLKYSRGRSFGSSPLVFIPDDRYHDIIRQADIGWEEGHVFDLYLATITAI